MKSRLSTPEKEPAIWLTTAQRRSLQQHLHSDSERVRSRALILLLSDKGDSDEQISFVLGIARRTVSRTRSRWREQSLHGLPDRPRSGRPPKVTKPYLEELFRCLRLDPRSLGYAFTRWTAPRLAEYLLQATGIEVSADWVAELLRAHRYVWRRTQQTLKNKLDPIAARRAQRELKQLKKRANGKTRASSFGLGMESSSNSSPSLFTPVENEGNPLP
jgi:transposase